MNSPGLDYRMLRLSGHRFAVKDMRHSIVLARVRPDSAGTGRALNLHDHTADLQIDFLPGRPTEEEDDYPQQHTQDAEHHKPETGGVDALDDPAVGQPDRAVGLLADPVGRRNEVYAVVRDDSDVGQREHQAADQFHPSLAAIRHPLREGVDPWMRVDRVAVTHP